MKTHNIIVLRFWVEGDVNPYVIWLRSHWCCIS